MILTTTDTIPGKNFEILGVVKGATVQSKHIGKDLMSGFKTIVGGELKAYTEMMDDAREQAIQRMLMEAAGIGADGIVGMRFTSSTIAQGAAEMMVYGTAVKFI